MPYTKEQMKEYNREYNKQNPRDTKEYSKNYYQKNKERLLQLEKERYRKKNPIPKIKFTPEEQKESKDKARIKYRATEKGQKIIKKQDWKKRGVKFTAEEFETIWSQYWKQTECECCGINFTEEWKHKKCLDHDHNTGEFRFILCWTCNINRKSD